MSQEAPILQQKLSPEALNQAGADLWQQGKKTEAEKFFREAHEIAPFHPLVLNSLGVIHQDHGEYDKAEQYYLKALTFAPQYAPIYDNLGRLHNAQKRFLEAQARFEAAVEYDPKQPEYLYNLATIHFIFNNFQKAQELYYQCTELDPKHYRAWIGQGECHANLGQWKEAQHCYESGLASNPTYAPAYQNLFISYDMTHCQEELERTLKAARENIPGNLRLAYIEARMAKKKKDYKRGLEYLENIEIPTDQLGVDILFEAGWMYDKLGESEKAYNCLVQANRLQEEGDPSRAIDIRIYPDQLRTEKALLTKKNIEKWAPVPENKNYPDPIFLIGFPRSGTTLMGQILHSHPDFYVGEENGALEAVRNFIAQNRHGYPNCLANLDPDFIEQARETYFNVHRNEPDWEEKKFIVDKSPLGSAHAALAYRLFPKAKFIFMMRHPCDAVFSCFMQKFRSNLSLVQFYNLDRAADFYTLVLDCWNHYCNILPIDKYILRYESLIDNFEGEVRKTLEFVGADWNESILDYNKKAKSNPRAMTPSFGQITKEIYTDARYRWERYQEQMAPVLGKLAPYVEKAGYEPIKL